jgi:hypothetical protein
MDGEMNNSRKIVELLTKSPDLHSTLQRRKADMLWQQLHDGNGTPKKIYSLNSFTGGMDKKAFVAAPFRCK